MLPQCNRGSFTTQNRLFYTAKQPVLIYRGVEFFWSRYHRVMVSPMTPSVLGVMEGAVCTQAP